MMPMDTAAGAARLAGTAATYTAYAVRPTRPAPLSATLAALCDRTLSPLLAAVVAATQES